jgi:large subunit ribosomal protein L23Ae
MASKTQQVNKAKQTTSAAKKTAIRRKYRVRTNLRFFRPSTLQVASKPKYARSTSALKLPGKFDKFSVLVHPLNTEKANKLMTERNTLTFIVHRLANKVQIKKAFNEIHSSRSCLKDGYDLIVFKLIFLAIRMIYGLIELIDDEVKKYS